MTIIVSDLAAAPLLDTATAKLHLRVDGDAEDSLLDVYISTAEGVASHYAGRYFYENLAALDAAVAAAPAALAAAVDTYDAAITAAEAMEAGTEQDAAIKYAEDALASAKQSSDMTQRGMVVTAPVRSALLLIISCLYENRGELEDIPGAAKALLDTVKVYG